MCRMKCWYFWFIYDILIKWRQIIRSLCGHRRARVGNPCALEVSMNSEKKGCTDAHMYTLILWCRLKMCACVREGCAVLGDKWVALDSVIVSRTTHLSPRTARCSWKQTHIWYLNFKSSLKVCSSVHPNQYWVHGRSTAVASILMCHVWLLLANWIEINNSIVL